MKKSLLFISIFFFASAVLFGQKKKVAVVTFYVDKYINADKIVETARQATYEMTKEDDPRFDLRPVLEEFHKTFVKDFSKDFPFEIVQEKKVLEHQMYKAYNGLDGVEDQDSIDMLSEALNDRFIAIDGYKVLLTGGNMLRSWRTEAHMNKILEDLNIDGVMFVSMYYQWEPKIAVGGMGNAGIRAYITMELFNKESKKVAKIQEYATSKKSVALIDGAPILDYKKLMPMCEDATARLLEDLQKELPKLVKKVDKNL